MNFPKYSKILNIYDRDPVTGKLIDGQYSQKVFRHLKDMLWVGAEKVDGTNIRLCWDGDRVTIKGKREESSVPPFLMEYLTNRFCTPEVEELFEKKFGVTPAVIFGEGYGKGIQGYGSKYDPEGNHFIAFDVCFPESGLYLSWPDMCNTVDDLGIDRVPVLIFDTLDRLVQLVKDKPLSTLARYDIAIEGLVARPVDELRTNQGRVMCKIKTRDF